MHFWFGKINDSKISSNSCHRTLVVVFKFKTLVRSSFHSPQILEQVICLVNGNVCNLWVSLWPFWRFHVGKVTKHIDVLKSFHFVITVNPDPVTSHHERR